MDIKHHTSQCTKRQQKAEELIKAPLHDPICNRCKLNLAAPDLFMAIKHNEINAQTILVEALRGDIEKVKEMLRKMCSIHGNAIKQTGLPINEKFED